MNTKSVAEDSEGAKNAKSPYFLLSLLVSLFACNPNHIPINDIRKKPVNNIRRFVLLISIELFHFNNDYCCCI